MFKHFLFTRFNLRFDDWELTRSGNSVLNEDWLTERFRLFKMYCLPSVLNQSNQHFTWFIFFDINTPEIFKQEIKTLQEQYSNLQPVFIESGKNFRSSIAETIKSNISEDDKYVLTSRIDNDDIIHKDFIATVQDLFQPINTHVIDIRSGYQLVVEQNENRLLKFDLSYNPFISLVETPENAKSVFSRDHRDWRSEKSITVFKGKRLWVQVVHKNNLLNYKRKLRGIFTINYADFGINKEQIPLAHPMKVLVYNSKWMVLNFLLSGRRKIKSAFKLLFGKKAVIKTNFFLL
jgi:hypothetical protein